MKKSLIFFLVAAAVSLSGCDFFRKVAGRPTSGDIESKKAEIQRTEARAKQAKIDSLEAVKKMMADSLAALDSLREMKSSLVESVSFGGLYNTELESRYYVVVGAFRNRENADRLLQTVLEKGFYPTIIHFGNGLVAVGVAQCNKLSDALLSLKSVKREDFCPDDVWILVNK